MDTVTPEVRSEIMSRIRGKHTRPERAVRSFLHRAGYRFRLHRHDLPGSPDIVLPSRRIAIFVNGCFWHRHNGCPKAYMPKSRVEYWSKRFADNVARDQRKTVELELLGWDVVTIWECETEDDPLILQALRERSGGRLFGV